MSNEIAIEPVNIKPISDFEDQAIDLTRDVAVIKIIDQPSYEIAAGFLKNVKDMAKKVEISRKSIVDPINKAKDAIQALFNPVLLRLENSERHLKGLMIAYSTEQERIRAEKEEKLRQQAAVEEARQRKIKEEQERQWREKENAAAAELARQNALIANAKNEKQRAEAEAAAAIAKAEQAKAAAKAEERAQQAAEVQVIAPTIAPTFQKAAGTSLKKNWKARIINEAVIPRDYLMVDLSKLDKVAKATQGSLNIPGVQFYFENVLGSTSR